MPFKSAPLENAWQQYHATLEALRETMLALPYAQAPAEQAKIATLMQQAQAVTYAMFIAPNQRYPVFYKHTVFLPNVFTWVAPCADFLYRFAFVDGRRTYRIWGRRSNTRFFNIQVLGQFWEKAQMKLLATYDLDDFVEQDGSFEIFAGPVKHGDHWIELDPTSANNAINIREAFYDWEGERETKIYIEPIAPGEGPLSFTEDEMIERLEGAARWVTTALKLWSGIKSAETVGRIGLNQTEVIRFSGDDGCNPAAGYCVGGFNHGPDEALILETEVPNARYWAAQTSDFWWLSVDYNYHQCSLNGHQAKIDRDGKFRAVLCNRDPGVANWLDTMDSPLGYLIVRWYFSEQHFQPTLKLVKFDEIHKHLPADTVRVTPDERAQILHGRARAAYRRWGY